MFMEAYDPCLASRYFAFAGLAIKTYPMPSAMSEKLAGGEAW
jgi:hypothetical protein